MQGDHVEDQIIGYKIERVKEDIELDYKIRKSAFEEQKAVLNSKDESVSNNLQMVTSKETAARKENHAAAKEAAQQENIKKGGLTEENANLRNDNSDLRKNFGTRGNELLKEQTENHGLIKQHDEIVDAYNATIDKYNDLLSQVAKTRVELETETNSVQSGISKENYSFVSLGRANDHTLSSNGILSDTSKQLKTQLGQLQSKYKSFIESLTKITDDQDKEAQSLENKVKEISNEVNSLTHVLKEQTVSIEQLHEEVDKENAANLNARLRHLIDTLVNVDSKRKTAQQNLEDGQTKWSIKLRLFLDEASRRSRETAREKRMHEIEKTISKIDHITREIYRMQTELERAEIKLFTDSNRNLNEKELKNELDGIKLKLRWAEDERRLAFGELETLLSILREIDIREMQVTEIEELRKQIYDYRQYLVEFKREIDELEREIALADRKIEELIELINQINAEIDELNRILKERMQRINQLQKALGQSTKSKFSAVKGDSVDEMLAQFLSIANCRVPVIRLGGGFYLFGTRKIYAKIMNGKLVVRVGGGYMVIDEFVATYEEPELNKLYKLCEKEGVDSIYELDLEAITGIYADTSKGGMSPGGRSPGGRSPGGKNSPGGSMKNKSFKTAASSSINGTNRSPRVTAAALKNARQIQ